jgi:Amt family ammonium transporter
MVPGCRRLLLLLAISISLLTQMSLTQAVAEDALPVAAETESENPAPAEPAPAPTPPAPITAESVKAEVEAFQGKVDLLWTCLAAFLVFFMQLGFACVESGLTRAKSLCNIMMKNLMDFCIGALVFWAVGFGLMFGNSNGYIGTSFFFLNPEAGTEAESDDMATNKLGFKAGELDKTVSQTYAFLIFQTVFAATAATIVSGAMAERTKFASYLIYTSVISAVIYPISGGWAWNGLFHLDEAGVAVSTGWLEVNGFTDFAGSTVVHLCGGAAALAGAIALGPRLGKYNANGTVNAIPGHNIGLAAIGVFVLWLGWFGFNPGSTTALGDGSFARIAVVTNVAACAGGIAAMVTAWVIFGKPETTMSLNGVLAGLVAITAGCNNISLHGGIVLGAVAGIVVVLSVILIERIGIDDPVGAVSVHGVCGALGTIAVGIPILCLPGKAASFMVQVLGVLAIGGFSFIATSLLFAIIKATVGLRVTQKEEQEGLDMFEHGNEGYHGFVFAQGRSS